MRQGFNFGLFVRGKGGNDKIAAATINLGSTKGRGSSTRMFNYCNQRTANPSECINQFINVTAATPGSYLYSKNNTTSGGFPIGESVNKDMRDRNYTYIFNPQDYYPEYFPGMAPFINGNIVAGDKSPDERLLASEWLDWGNDIFDSWGFFYLYDVETGKYYFPLITPQNQANGSIFTQTFNAFGRVFTIKQGYPVQGIFKFDISVNDNKPFKFGGYGDMGYDDNGESSNLIYPYLISSTNLTLYYAKQEDTDGEPGEIIYSYFIPKKVSENNNQTYDLYPANPLGNTNSFIVSKTVTNGLIVYFSKTNDVKEWVVNDLGIQTSIPTPTPFTVPSAPLNVTASVLSLTSANVSWSAPSSNGGSPIISYTITSTPGSFTLTTSNINGIITGLTTGTSYTFRVVATNAVGNSQNSSASNPIPPATVPSAPLNVTASVFSLTSANVSWSPPLSNGGSPITAYTITSTPGSFTLTTSNTNGIITGLTSGTSYTFRVLATNAAGNSPESSASSPIIMPIPISGTFIYSFNYSGSNLASDVSNNIPLISGNELSYTYSYTNISNLITVTIPFIFTDINSTNDGVNFYTNNAFTFYNNTSLVTSLQISQFNGIPLSRSGSQFREITTLNISAIDAPTILSNTSMESAFKQCTNLSGNISNWNTSNVTNMSRMFESATNFNQYIGDWNTSNVTNMSYMFDTATNFNQDISSKSGINAWNTSNVTDMAFMFYDASEFNESIGNWNTSNVEGMGYMFLGASKFNQPIGNWITSNVIGMQHMFERASEFNQDISSKPGGVWDTSKVTDMGVMFDFALAFNNGEGPTGNTAKMNWIVTQFGGVTPQFFSRFSSLTLAPDGNSPFDSDGSLV